MATTKLPSAEEYTPKSTDLVLEDGTIIIDGKVPKPVVPEKRVKVKIPKIFGQKVQEDVPLTINGKTILIQRGVEVEIPESYAQLLSDTEAMIDEKDSFVSERAN